MRELFEENFTVLDLETTGGRPEQNGIMEIGLMKIRNRSLGEQFSTLVNPGYPIPPFVQKITGITHEMLVDAPPFGEIAGFVSDFLDCDILVLHNSPFDLQFLNYHFEKLGMARSANPILCTVKLGERLFPEAPNRRLETLAAYLQIPMEARHRAPSDVDATAKIFIECLERLQKEGVTTLAQLCRWLWTPVPKS